VGSLLILLACPLGGCLEWTEGPQGQVTSIGVPGAAQPVWHSQTNPTPITTADLGMSPEEAANVSGPVLVLPPTAASSRGNTVIIRAARIIIRTICISYSWRGLATRKQKRPVLYRNFHRASVPGQL